jgi:hypothetical protein
VSRRGWMLFAVLSVIWGVPYITDPAACYRRSAGYERPSQREDSTRQDRNR